MSLPKLEIFKSPQCLVESCKEGILRLKEHVVKEISAIENPIIVVGITGLYRTGKSYLMNRLAQEKSGFPLGNTIQAATKGIWIWCKDHPTQQNTVLLLMDTEGFGDVEKGNKNHDTQIFTLTVLMSKVVCYNIKGVLDMDAIERIALSSKMAVKIQKKGKLWSPPELVICLRDFSLDFEKDGKILTGDEYLQIFLNQQSAKPSQNVSRELIRDLYKSMKCFAFDFPGNKNLLKTLETAREEDLSQDFLNDTQKFKEYVYTVTPAVMANIGYMSGLAFSTLIRGCVEAFQVGELPDVPSNLERWSAVQNDKLVACIVEKHSQEIKDIELPVLSTATFKEMYEHILERCLKEVRDNIISESKEQYIKTATTQMWTTIKKVEIKNNEQCFSHWMRSIPILYNEIVGSKQIYCRIGGFEEYKMKLQKFKVSWNRTTHISEQQRKLALEKFLEMRSFEEEEIFEENKKLEELRKENASKEQQYVAKKLLLAQQRQFEEQQEAAERQRKEEEKILSQWKQDRLNQLCQKRFMMEQDLQNYIDEKRMEAKLQNAREHEIKAKNLLREYQSANHNYSDSD